MTATAAPPRRPAAPGLHSPTQAGRTLGERMGTTQILDVIEQLLVAAKHPDIVAIDRYGPGLGPWGPSVEESKVKRITGVKVTHQSTATASLWEAVWPGGQPVPAPTDLPPDRRATRLLVFTAQLLDFAKPDQLRSWQLLALPDLGPDSEQGATPAGLGLVATDGAKVLLRSTSTGPTVGTEPAEDPFPDYVIPEGVRTCLREANAASAAPA
jgi:hypothetical protein